MLCPRRFFRKFLSSENFGTLLLPLINRSREFFLFIFKLRLKEYNKTKKYKNSIKTKFSGVKEVHGSRFFPDFFNFDTIKSGVNVDGFLRNSAHFQGK